MAQCKAEGRKYPTMDLYVGIFNSKLYSSHRDNNGDSRSAANNAVNWSKSHVRDSASSAFYATALHREVPKDKTSVYNNKNLERENGLLFSNGSDVMQAGKKKDPQSGSDQKKEPSITRDMAMEKSSSVAMGNRVEDQENQEKKTWELENLEKKRRHQTTTTMTKTPQADSTNKKTVQRMGMFLPPHKPTIDGSSAKPNAAARSDGTTSAIKKMSSEEEAMATDVPDFPSNDGNSENRTMMMQRSASSSDGMAGWDARFDADSKTEASQKKHSDEFLPPRRGKNAAKSAEMNSTKGPKSLQRSGELNVAPDSAAKSGLSDSSSSHGGSSNGGSPVARRTSTTKDGNRSSSSSSSSSSSASFGNILTSGKGSPGYVSHRWMMNGGSKSVSGEAISGRNSGEMAMGRKSGEMATTGNPNPSSRCSNGAYVSSRNSGNLLVGSGNGNIMSYGGSGKSCARQQQQGGAEGNRAASADAVDMALLRRAHGSSDPEEMKNAGNEYYKRGQYTEALMLYEMAMELCSTNAAYRSNKAAALCGLGRLAEAVCEYEEAIRMDPGYARARQRLASLYLRLGLTGKANRHLLIAAKQQSISVDAHCLQNIEKHLTKCIQARKIGDWYTVIKESDAAVVAGADSAPQIFGYKSEALLRVHKPEDADTVCMAAQRIAAPLVKLGVLQPDPFLLIIRAGVDIALGRLETALSAAESAVKIDPSNADAAAILHKVQAVASTRTAGNNMFKSGRYFEALALYSEGLESDPNNAILLCNRAVCRSKLGQWEKAVEDCNAALRIQPNYTKALMRRANCWTKIERWEEALEDYEALRRSMPDDLDVARSLFDVQVAIRKSRGEEVHRMKFGGDVGEVFSDEQFQEVISAPGKEETGDECWAERWCKVTCVVVAGLSVVEFITRWNDRCQQLCPFVDVLCKRNPCVNFVKVDVEENPSLAKIECVNFIPTFKIYMNGQKVKEIVGPTEQLLEYTVKQFSM